MGTGAEELTLRGGYLSRERTNSSQSALLRRAL
jgi:hypothetical protein